MQETEFLGHRWCVVCREIKPLAAFDHRRKHTTCSTCNRKGWLPPGYLDAYPAGTPLPFGPPPWRYPLTIQQKAVLEQVQVAVCAICGGPPPLVVDHKHDRNRFVRGLLCCNCNNGLGFFLDSPERLRKAAEYLEKPVLPMKSTATRSWVLSRARGTSDATTVATDETGTPV